MKNFIPLVNLPEHYEAYLYLIVFHHDKLMKYYFGYHEGRFESGIYKGSPKTHEEEFLKDLGKYDYEIYALKCGEVGEIIFLERIMLHNLKNGNPQPKDYPILPSSNWKEYYNESEGGGAKLQGCSVAVNDIQDAIEAEDWNTGGSLRRVKVDKNVVRSWAWHQVRPVWLIQSHVAALKLKIEDSDGKWLDAINEKTGKPNFRGVLVLEDYHGKDDHLRIGSAHTTESVQNIGQVTDLWVIFIPKKMWKLNGKALGKSDIKGLGQWDNTEDEMPHLSTPLDEHIDWIVETCIEKNIIPDFWVEHELLRRRVAKKLIPGLKTKAVKRLENIEEFEKTGTKQVDHDRAAAFVRKNAEHIKKGIYPRVEEGTREYELIEKIKAFNGDYIIGSAGNENRIIIDMTELLRQNFIEPNGSKEKNYMILVKHTVKDGSITVQENWDEFDKPHLRSTIRLWKEMFKDKDGKPTLNIRIEELEFSEPDPTFETLH